MGRIEGGPRRLRGPGGSRGPRAGPGSSCRSCPALRACHLVTLSPTCPWPPGKSFTMIGRDSSPQSLGVVPCAISWLFRLLDERKERTGTRFSVRVSAVEVCGRDQSLRDLLAEVASSSLQDAQSPGVYLREDPVCGAQVRGHPCRCGGSRAGGVGAAGWGRLGKAGGELQPSPEPVRGCSPSPPPACPQLQNQSELRAPTAERAAFYLDAALAARSSGRAGCSEDARCSSHVLFTLHVYQYRMEKCSRGGSTCRQDCAGGRGWEGWGAGPSLHPPALWFQCPEAAAACTSSTWAAVRGRRAGAGRPPGAPCVCPCRPWAASSWPWSAEPSTCPTGERRPPRQAWVAPGTRPVHVGPPASGLFVSAPPDRPCGPRAGGGSWHEVGAGRRRGPGPARSLPPTPLQPWHPRPQCPQGAQAHHAAAGVPGRGQLPRHHDRPRLRRAGPPRRDAQHRAAGGPHPPSAQEEGQGGFRLTRPPPRPPGRSPWGSAHGGGGAGAPAAIRAPGLCPRRGREPPPRSPQADLELLEGGWGCWPRPPGLGWACGPRGGYPPRPGPAGTMPGRSQCGQRAELGAPWALTASGLRPGSALTRRVPRCLFLPP